MSDRVAVVGGGIAGLATAFHLARAGADPVVFERDDVPGGIVAPPIEVGDLWLEPGPDSLAARKAWGADLCRRLGLTLIAPGASGAFLWTDAGLVPYLSGTAFGIPGDVGDVLRWAGLSRRGRVRALADLVKRKRRDGADETLGELLRRRLGDEATDLAIAPLLAGLHAGDVDRLSTSATFPELLAWERTQGSLIRGAQAAQRSARGGQPGPLFVRPSGGMRELVDALADALGDRVRTGAEVMHVGDREVQLVGGAEPVDAVVLACGAYPAAEVLEHAAPTELSSIRSVSTGVVFLVYPFGTADALPDGTGFVVPRGKAPMTAATFVSRKWPDERFGDRAIVRCYVGGAGDEDVLDAPDEDIVEACARHLSAVLDLPEPSASRVHRWWRAMPQYEIGHLGRVQRIREALPPGIFLVGSAFDGVGVSDLARAAEQTAALVLESAGAPRKEPA
ncbi:MAG TPA: protoporphyrinogen oxidase [Actinomycetota bacterium]|nr:protoporphyrinogen oxidase [Actinomycetota bacterium]